jgi:prevent-host-death family protein
MYTQSSHKPRQNEVIAMEPVNILDARNNLSQLIQAATRGEDVVISKRGKPLVRIVPIVDERAHTGAEFGKWLAANPLPSGSARAAGELDEQIAREREAWE